MLSSEQGVYVAESVAAKNVKQAKGRFRMYDDNDDVVILGDSLLFYWHLLNLLAFICHCFHVFHLCLELLILLPAIHYDCFSLLLLLLLFLSFTSDPLVSNSQGNGVSNHSVKREQAGREASGVGKKEPMKSAKKPGM